LPKPKRWVKYKVPRIFEENGFRVYILLPPREHGPPHVHVMKAGGKIVIDLGFATGQCEIDRISGMKPKDVLRAFRIVDQSRELLLQEWSKLHD